MSETMSTHTDTAIPSYPKKTVIRGYVNPPSTPVSKDPLTQPEPVVPQEDTTPVSTPMSAAKSQDDTAISKPEKVIITRIVETPGENIAKWKKYAKHYYKQSLTSVTPEARLRNRKTYLKNRELLEITGKYTFTEGAEKLVIKEV